MYVVLEHNDGQAELYSGDIEVFGGWRWRPAPRVKVIGTSPLRIVTIEATDGPYGGPEYPTGGPR